MRYQGRILDWNDERGFGFIAPNGGGAKVFIHISSFPRHTPRPASGDLVTYEVTVDGRGRPRARDAAFIGMSRRPSRAPQSTWPSLLLVGALLVVAAYVGYVRLSHPGSTVPATIYKILFARDALDDSHTFACEPAKSSCSRMTSCAEALFHQERCGVIGLDGDRDGIPCEQQWCN